MSNYAELELNLTRRDSELYAVELRYTTPGSDAETHLGHDRPLLVRFDNQKLLTVELDARRYGQVLAAGLFAQAELASAFAQARAQAQSLATPLRIRLSLDATALELHRLRWETLTDPVDHDPLFLGERVLFSRYLASRDWRPVQPRSRGDLRALIAVPSPTNFDPAKFAAVDASAEAARARAGLSGLPATVLAVPESTERVTVNTLFAHLREGYDVLYLACHGALKEEPWLFLETDEGKFAPISGSEFVARLKELAQLPRLIVLASCQSADRSDEATIADDGTLAALGPRLAEAGVPAVLAMQGQVSMQTIAQFIPVFFRELQSDGQIDRALAVARGTVRNRSDWWMPVLFMRLKSGQLWYTSGFGHRPGDAAEQEVRWRNLALEIRDAARVVDDEEEDERKQCTPILGPGLLEPLIGAPRDWAYRWAADNRFPFDPNDQDESPKVAQHLANINEASGLLRIYRETLREELIRRHTAPFSPELQTDTAWTGSKLLRALREAAPARWGDAPTAPYRALAALRLPIYLTTNPDDLLTQALEASGLEPRVRLCPWNDAIRQYKSELWEWKKDEAPPTSQRPLVYHLFGRLDKPESLVLTEDQYFDYLIGVTLNKDHVPSVVRAALNDALLMFIGFRVDDWTFRVLFRTIMTQQGVKQLERYRHVAVQLEPDESRLLNPYQARQELERYFGAQKIDLYWGSAADFLRDLAGYLRA